MLAPPSSNYEYIAVCPGAVVDIHLQHKAKQIADSLNLPLFQSAEKIPKHINLLLVVTTQRLELHVIGGNDKTIYGGNPIAIDWQSIDTTSPAGRSLKQPIAKAVGIKKGNKFRPNIIDATAGLGEDSWILASLGCNVTMVERNPIVAALLEDAMTRAQTTNPDIAQTINLIKQNSAEYISSQISTNNHNDVIYIDPMFPHKRKTAQKKSMKVLRMIVGEDDDSNDILSAALQTKLRVVVKRPTHAMQLSNIEPVFAHKAKGFRFDIYGR